MQMGSYRAFQNKGTPNSAWTQLPLHIPHRHKMHVKFFFPCWRLKNIFISLLHFGGGKLATLPPPPLRLLTDSGIRVSDGFSLLWRTFAVKWPTRTPKRYRIVRRLATMSWFSPRNIDGEQSEPVLPWNDFQMAYKMRTVTGLLHT